MRQSFVFTTIFPVLIAFLAGACLVYFFTKPQSQSVTSVFPNLSEHRLNGNYQFISPLLECSSQLGSYESLRPLNKQLTQLISNQKKQKFILDASIYYRDLNNGPSLGINEQAQFSPASLTKVPLLITYLKQAEKSPSILKKTILNYHDQSDDLQNIIPGFTIQKDQAYEIKDLLKYMIIYSDNNSFYLLVDYLQNDEEILGVYKDLGINVLGFYNDPYGNILSVIDYSTFFRILYNSSYLNEPMSEQALKLLSQTEFKDGLIAGLPQDIIVSHKFGERDFPDTNLKQLHDCGIIYAPQKPYLLCVMTKGDDFTHLSQFISQVSSLVYQNL